MQRIQQLLRKPQDRRQKRLAQRPVRIIGRETGLHQDRIKGLENVPHPVRISEPEIGPHQDRIRDREIVQHLVRISEPATGHRDRISAPETDQPDRVIGLRDLEIVQPAADLEIVQPAVDPEIGPLVADLEIGRQEDVRERDLLAENRQLFLQEPNR